MAGQPDWRLVKMPSSGLDPPPEGIVPVAVLKQPPAPAATQPPAAATAAPRIHELGESLFMNIYVLCLSGRFGERGLNGLSIGAVRTALKRRLSFNKSVKKELRLKNLQNLVF